jgi:hypothetical protein
MNPENCLVLIAGLLLLAVLLALIRVWAREHHANKRYHEIQKELADHDAWRQSIGYERPKIVPKKGGDRGT